jgi:signal transduction histidine kinase
VTFLTALAALAAITGIWEHARAVARRSLRATCALAVRVERAAEEERARISRELHDDLGQRLVALKLQLQIARLAGGITGVSRLDECLAAADGLIADVRLLSRSLRPAPFEAGHLISGLTALATTEAKRGGFCVLVDAPDDDNAAVLSRDAELACYRVICEAFTNIVKHAHARHVALSVSRGPEDIRIRVADDGDGFDVGPVVRQAALSGQLGLLGMNERLAQAGGSVAISSKRGGGTVVECRVPARAATVAVGEAA